MQGALNEKYFLCVQNKLILMAGAGSSWQGIGWPQCGQHKLLSFARIIAVATVAVVAKYCVFFFSPVCLYDTHYLWPDSAIPTESRLHPLRSESSWLTLFLRMDTSSPPSYSHCLRQVTLLTSGFAVVGWNNSLLYCNLGAAAPKLGGWEGTKGCAMCPLSCHMMKGHSMSLTLRLTQS